MQNDRRTVGAHGARRASGGQGSAPKSARCESHGERPDAEVRAAGQRASPSPEIAPPIVDPQLRRSPPSLEPIEDIPIRTLDLTPLRVRSRLEIRASAAANARSASQTGSPNRRRSRAPTSGCPPPDLLQEPPERTAFDSQELKEIAARIKSKFEEFNVLGSVTQINPGPVVTTFEFKPEAGVKYSRITTLSEDLCLGLQAESILIERIPGKPTVGIEVPNSKREVISLRQILESDEFHARLRR